MNSTPDLQALPRAAPPLPERLRSLWGPDLRSNVDTVGEIAHGLWKDLSGSSYTSVAAQMSYYFVLSFFPFLLLLASVAGALAASGEFEKLLNWFARYFPVASQQMLIDTMLGLAPGKTAFLSLSIFGTAWAASWGILNLMESLNSAYQVQETRPFWKRLGVALLMLVALSVLLFASFTLSTASNLLGDWLAHQMALPVGLHFAWKFANWFLSLTLVLVATALIDHVLPNVERRCRWVTPGSMFVLSGWVLTSVSFNFYVKHIATYGTLYGSLGGIVILMIWVYVISLITLIGARLNWRIQELCRLRNASQIPADVKPVPSVAPGVAG